MQDGVVWRRIDFGITGEMEVTVNEEHTGRDHRLIAQLAHLDPATRHAAIDELAGYPEIHVVDALIHTLLDEDDAGVVTAIISTLKRINTPRAVTPLKRIQTKWLGTPVKTTISNALLHFEQQDVAELLTRARNQRYLPSTREKALCKLVERGIPEAFQIAIDALQEPEAGMRAISTGILAAIGDLRAIEPLGACLADQDWDVRFDAARALSELGDPRGKAFLMTILEDPDPQKRIAALNVLNDIWQGGDSYIPFLEASRDENPEVRETAVYSLAENGGAEVAIHLLRALLDGAEAVRISAVYGLHAIFGMELDEILDLLSRSDDPQMRQAVQSARQALYSFGN